MLPAVSFDDEPSLLAYEVGDERPNRLLTPELGPIQLAIAERRPQFALGIGHVTAEALGSC